MAFMRIVSNPPCKLCSSDNVQKHCFACGGCRIKFIGNITYNGIEYGLCSEKCEENYIRTREFGRYKLYGLKHWGD